MTRSDSAQMENFADDNVTDSEAFFNFENSTPKIGAVYQVASVAKSTMSTATVSTTQRPIQKGKGSANPPITSKRKIQSLIPAAPSMTSKRAIQPLIPPASSMVQTKGQVQHGSRKAAGPQPIAIGSSPGPSKQTVQFTMDANNVICFFGRDHFLSNFFQFPFEIDGFRYYSIEHYYEAVKLFTFLGPNGAAQLKTVRDPSAAKSIARRLLSDSRIDRKRIEQWRRQDGIFTVMHALMTKFYPGTVMARQLVGTGTALLAQANPHDDLWAVNMNAPDFMAWVMKNDKKVLKLPAVITNENVDTIPAVGRKGKNLLGFLLMEVRRKLQALTEASPTVETAVLSTINEESGEAEEIAGGADSVMDHQQRCEEIGRRLAAMCTQEQMAATVESMGDY